MKNDLSFKRFDLFSAETISILNDIRYSNKVNDKILSSLIEYTIELDFLLDCYIQEAKSKYGVDHVDKIIKESYESN